MRGCADLAPCSPLWGGTFDLFCCTTALMELFLLEVLLIMENYPVVFYPLLKFFIVHTPDLCRHELFRHVVGTLYLAHFCDAVHSFSRWLNSAWKSISLTYSTGDAGTLSWRTAPHLSWDLIERSLARLFPQFAGADARIRYKCSNLMVQYPVAHYGDEPLTYFAAPRPLVELIILEAPVVRFCLVGALHSNHFYDEVHLFCHLSNSA